MRTDVVARLMECIDLIYESVAQRAVWPQAMRSVNGLLQGNGVFHGVFNDNGTVGRASVIGVPEEALRLYETLSHLDRRIVDVSHLPAGSIFNDCRMTDRPGFEKSEIFNSMLKPYDVPNHLCAVLQNSTQYYGVLAIQRSAAAGPCTQADEDLLRLLIPHLMRSSSLQLLINDKDAQISLLLEAADRLPFGVAFLDANGRVLQISKIMKALLNDGDGLCYAHGRLGARRVDEDSIFQRAVLQRPHSKDPRQYGGSSLVITRDGNRAPLTVWIMPLPRNALSFNVRSLVIAHDPDRSTFAPLPRVMRSFSLTRSEARLAMLVAQGSSLREAAIQLVITVNTCKTQLKSIYQKTNSRNRTDLVRSISGLGVLKDG
jgi:DNA-binding CsgD family transcriptional regulator